MLDNKKRNSVHAKFNTKKLNKNKRYNYDNVLSIKLIKKLNAAYILLKSNLKYKNLKKIQPKIKNFSNLLKVKLTNEKLKNKMKQNFLIVF